MRVLSKISRSGFWGFSKVLFHLEIPRFIRYLNRQKIIILVYHGFTDKKNHKGIENDHGIHLNIEKFRCQIEYLKKYYRIITLNELVKYYKGNIKLPNNTAAITIDDGYKSNYIFAYPILKQFNIPATIFLTTDFINKKEPLWVDRVGYAINMTKIKNLDLIIDSKSLSFDLSNTDLKKMAYGAIYPKLNSAPQELRKDLIEALESKLKEKLAISEKMPEIYRPLEWHEITEMIRSGIISVGSHACTHTALSHCNLERMKEELIFSRKIIENKTGVNSELFSYPSGKSCDFNNETKRLLKETTYACGLTNIAGMNDKHSDVYELKRLGIENKRGDIIIFAMILSGLMKFFDDIKQSILNLFKRKREVVRLYQLPNI